MIGKKLLTLLKELTPTEFRRLRKLLQSPIYTNNPDHLRCYDHLRKYYPTFDSPRLQKEILYKKLWKKEAYDDWKLRNLFRELTRLTEDYLLLLEQESCKLYRKKQLVQLYGRRNLYDFFEKGTKSLLSDLEALPYRDKNYYLQKAQLNEALYFHPLKDKYDVEDTVFEAGNNSIDQYFIYTKMQYGIALKAQQKVLKSPYQIRFLDLINVETEKNLMTNCPLLRLQYWSFLLLEQPEKVDFAAYQQLLFSHLAQLRLDDQKLLFTNGLNFLIRQANTQSDKFNLLIFQWYQKGLIHELILENKQLNAAHFTNIITYACLTKQFDWAIQFMQDYQAKLALKEPEAIICFNKAKWHYYQREFEAGLILLATCKLPIAYQPAIKNLELRIIFELFLKDYNYHELLFAKINAFETYLRNSKVFAPTKTLAYLNHLKVLFALAKRLIAKETSAHIRRQLLPQLTNTSNMIGKQWLLEKVEELAV